MVYIPLDATSRLMPVVGVCFSFFTPSFHSFSSLFVVVFSLVFLSCLHKLFLTTSGYVWVWLWVWSRTPLYFFSGDNPDSLILHVFLLHYFLLLFVLARLQEIGKFAPFPTSSTIQSRHQHHLVKINEQLAHKSKRSRKRAEENKKQASVSS